MRTLSLLLVSTLAWVLVGAGLPAHATSCVMIEDGRPESIVTGTEKLWSDDGFFELFDYAVTGVVTDVLVGTDGTAEVIVDVINGFGVEAVPAEITFTMPDAGAMIGYNFTPGRVYFIPMHHSPDQPPMICDPISEMSLADAEALPDIATVPVATIDPPPSETPAVPVDTPTAAPDVAGFTQSMMWPLVGVVAVAVAGIVVAAVVIRRRRNSPDGPT